MAGVSRSVSFVLAYLMKYRRMKLDDAYNVVLNNRTIVKAYAIISDQSEYWFQETAEKLRKQGQGVVEE